MRGTNPNSIKNLKPFKKGESGNPGGRSKSFTNIKDELKNIGDEVVYFESIDDIIDGTGATSKTKRQLVLRAIWSNAIDGDFKAIELLERLGCLD